MKTLEDFLKEATETFDNSDYDILLQKSTNLEYHYLKLMRNKDIESVALVLYHKYKINILQNELQILKDRFKKELCDHTLRDSFYTALGDAQRCNTCNSIIFKK